MSNHSEHMTRLVQLRAKVDKAIQLEADRQGIPVPEPVPMVTSGEGIGYVVLTGPTLAHAAAQIAAAAERWGQA